MKIGDNIRRIRSEKGIEPGRLALALHWSEAQIEEIESGAAEPAISDLLRIARALDCDVSALIYGKSVSEKKCLVTRKSDRVRVERAHSLFYESLAPNYAGRHMEPFATTIFASKESRHETSRHAGEEFHYVLEGRLGITVDGVRHELDQGDAIYFDSSLPHVVEGVDGPVKVVAALYNGESMLQLTRSRKMRDLIEGAKHIKGTRLALACPDDTSIEAVQKAIEENVIEQAWFFGDEGLARTLLAGKERRIVFKHVDAGAAGYHEQCAARAVEAVRQGSCRMLMKGDLNTSVFLKAVLHKTTGIGTGRRLSMVSVIELPGLDRVVFLTDPAINPALTSLDHPEVSHDIILNAIEVARGLGVDTPRVAILDANELPSAAIPSSMHARQLSEQHWEHALVYGPLSYDLALYPEAVEHKGMQGNPVAGRADVLVTPFVSAGNFLYKAWVQTMAAEVANIVVGARAPILITSRSDSDMTKFLTICASAVYGQFNEQR
jgi:phosphate butyryltransferase